MQDPAQLPQAELIELLSQQRAELAASALKSAQLEDINRQLEAKIDLLEKDYLKLWQERFGAKSERYIANPDQLRIDFGDTAQAADAADGLADAVEDANTIPENTIPEHSRRSPKKKRDESLPAHLRREVVVVDVSEAEKHCDQHGEKTQLPEAMWDVVETLKYTPPELYVEVRRYPKYACANQSECGVTSAERPTGLVEGDKYDATIAAEIITNKFAFHLPVYRQQDVFAGTGWTPSRSTLLNILTRAYFVIQPLLSYFKRVLQGDKHVACDDTSTTLLYPKIPPDLKRSDPKQKRIAEVFDEAAAENKSSINAKMWSYRGITVPLNVFDFTVSRHRDGPELFFQDYRGTLLGDCWHGFEKIAVASGGEIVRAACNSHARRKFFDAKDYPADRNKWLTWYQRLYDIETRAKTLSDDERLKLRQSESKSIWEEMRLELDALEIRTHQVVLPKSNLRKALNYLRNHWTELTRYLDDPKLPMDNNETEQLMRQVALGRKNWLFAGSVAGGERIAGFLTLVSSAHRNDLDVRAYVNDILKRLLAGETNYEPMLPWNWAKEHPESVRQFRREERRDRADRKQFERAKRRVRHELNAQRSASKSTPT